MKWNNIDQLAQNLEENHSDLEIEDLTPEDIKHLVLDLEDFQDDPEEVTHKQLMLIQEEWTSVRNHER